MTDLKNISTGRRVISGHKLAKKVELRWWWFKFDLRNRRTAIIDFLTGVLVLLISAAFSIGLYYWGLRAMGLVK